MKVLIIQQLELNTIQNRVTFKIKSEYYLELLTPETMKLVGSAENKITTDKNGENEPHLEIVELVLIISKIQEYCLLLYQTRRHLIVY